MRRVTATVFSLLILVHLSGFSLTDAMTQPSHPDPNDHGLQHATPRKHPSQKPAQTLRKRVKHHLEAGRIDAALMAAQRALARYPKDRSVHETFVSLHLSLAREMITAENFTLADQALNAIMKVEPHHRVAREWLQSIEQARTHAPLRIQQARRWIDLEWFDPAFTTLRQAIALRPDQADRWREVYRAAALGAGDDAYFTKNFHEAFYAYDAAMRLNEEQNRRPVDSMISRWMQSLVHAMAVDIEHVQYPPSYWKIILQRAAAVSVQGDENRALQSLLRGLAYENMGATDKAMVEYRGLLGKPISSRDVTRLQGHIATMSERILRLRREAMLRIRPWYRIRLSDRRKGFWLKTEVGEWQTLATPRFHIHHRNPRAARRVADALAFHFERIAGLMAIDPDDVLWLTPCDVYLYADGAAFRRATAQPKQVQAISQIQTRGSSLNRHVIHVYQTDPMLMSATLAHELAHLMIAAITGYASFNAVLNEGLALYVEPRSRNRQFAALFARLQHPHTITQLLQEEDVHPPEQNFYAEAYRLIAVLLKNNDMSMVLRVGTRPPHRSKLAKVFGFSSGHKLEKAYRRSNRLHRPSSNIP